MIKLVEDFQEVAAGASHTVTAPDREQVEVAASGIGQHFIQGGAAHPDSADAVVAVLADHVPAALLRSLLQIAELSFRMLIERADPEVKRSTLHFACSSSSCMWRSRTVRIIHEGFGLLSCCWN